MTLLAFAKLHAEGKPVFVVPYKVSAVLQAPGRGGAVVHVGDLGEVDVDESPTQVVAILTKELDHQLEQLGPYLRKQLAGGDA